MLDLASKGARKCIFAQRLEGGTAHGQFCKEMWRADEADEVVMFITRYVFEWEKYVKVWCAR